MRSFVYGSIALGLGAFLIPLVDYAITWWKVVLWMQVP